MSEVQSAIQRALRATSSGWPRRIRIASTPTSGRKVTRVRSGQFSIAPINPSERGDTRRPAPRRRSASRKRSDRGIRSAAGLPSTESPRVVSATPSGPSPSMTAPSPFFHKAEPNAMSGRTMSCVVELVEIPLVEEEEINRPEGARAPGRYARPPDIGDPGRSNAGEAHRQRQFRHPERHILGRPTLSWAGRTRMASRQNCSLPSPTKKLKPRKPATSAPVASTASGQSITGGDSWT